MAKFGKWLGGGLGWVMGGPVGALLGFSLGSLFDTANITVLEETATTQQSGRRKYSGDEHVTQPGDFAVSLMVLSAAVMRSDGKVLKTEVAYVRAFLIKQFGEQKAGQLLLLLREFLKQDIDLHRICQQIRQNMDHPSRLQLIHYLFSLSVADSELSPDEQEVIERIAIYLGVSQKDLFSIRAMFVQDQVSEYTILEIEETVNDEEVKRAYRKMAVKYHPDKVSHLGEEHQRTAKEKFQKVQEAYEKIKKRRGIA